MYGRGQRHQLYCSANATKSETILSAVIHKIWSRKHGSSQELCLRKLELHQLDETQWKVVAAGLKDKDVTAVNMSMNELAVFPLPLTMCSQLRKLDIRRNSLRCLPPAIGKLQCLCQLLVNENGLEDWPYELTDLQHLQELGRLLYERTHSL